MKIRIEYKSAADKKSFENKLRRAFKISKASLVKQYIDCPYEQKEQAKTLLGAVWDDKRKLWYFTAQSRYVKGKWKFLDFTVDYILDEYSSGGRPHKLNPEQISEIIKLRNQGMTYAEISKQYGVSRNTISRVCNQNMTSK